MISTTGMQRICLVDIDSRYLPNSVGTYLIRKDAGTGYVRGPTECFQYLRPLFCGHPLLVFSISKDSTAYSLVGRST